jgi:hypothetical protein
VNIEFIAVSLGSYQVNLLLDSTRVEERLAVIPMRVNCFCSDVSIVNTFLDVGSLFMNHEYTEPLLLRNSTSFLAKFEFMDVEDASAFEAKVTVGKYRGDVVAGRDNPLPVFIRPLQLGEFNMVRQIRIFGSSERPLPFPINGIAVGPRIKLSCDTIEFWVIKVLQVTKTVVTVLSDS